MLDACFSPSDPEYVPHDTQQTPKPSEAWLWANVPGHVWGKWVGPLLSNNTPKHPSTYEDVPLPHMGSTLQLYTPRYLQVSDADFWELAAHFIAAKAVQEVNRVRMVFSSKNNNTHIGSCTFSVTIVTFFLLHEYGTRVQ